MTDLTLYFGPNNDPGDHSLTRHWQYPHDPDFHNPAFTITRAGNVVSIAFAIRNRDSAAHTLDSVNLYAAACGLLTSASDVNTLVNMVVTTPSIGAWPNLDGQSMSVPAINSALDSNWSSTAVAPAITWTVPAFANSFIVIATLQSGSTIPVQLPHLDYASDPSVAIWLG
jgi:hypothetical protein